MNILVASSCRSRGIARWMPVLLAASFCLTVAISAQAAVIEFNYDGSYYPTDDPPPAGQSTWTVVRTGTPDIVPNSPAAGVARFLDDKTDARIAMFNSVEGTGLASDPGNVEWEYTCITSYVSSDVDGRYAFFGVRDEGGDGQVVMFAHSQDGMELFYSDGGGTIWVGESSLIGGYHTYGIRKYLDPSDVMQIEFSLDGNVEDTRPYTDLPDDASSDQGVGIWGNTRGKTEYLVDNVHFYCDSPAIEPIPGDANLDNVVNDQDASILAAHWQQTEMSWGDGDFNDDGVVNDQDASILAAHWQESQEGAAAVPEPSTVVLLAFAAASMLVWWRRK